MIMYKKLINRKLIIYLAIPHLEVYLRFQRECDRRGFLYFELFNKYGQNLHRKRLTIKFHNRAHKELL